jgi:hypothetical protein
MTIQRFQISSDDNTLTQQFIESLPHIPVINNSVPDSIIADAIALGYENEIRFPKLDSPVQIIELDPSQNSEFDFYQSVYDLGYRAFAPAVDIEIVYLVK